MQEFHGRKVCAICEKTKNLGDFYQKQSKVEGSVRYDSQCKKCKKANLKAVRDAKCSIASPNVTSLYGSVDLESSPSRQCENLDLVASDMNRMIRIFDTLAKWRDEEKRETPRMNEIKLENCRVECLDMLKSQGFDGG